MLCSLFWPLTRSYESRLNFEPGKRLALAGTIQFGTSIHEAKRQLSEAYPQLVVPQSKPLSPGALAENFQAGQSSVSIKP